MHHVSQIQLLMWPTNPAGTAVLEVTLCHHQGAPELCLFCPPAWLSPIMSHVRSHILCPIVLISDLTAYHTSAADANTIDQREVGVFQKIPKS